MGSVQQRKQSTSEKADYRMIENICHAKMAHLVAKRFNLVSQLKTPGGGRMRNSPGWPRS